MRCCCSGWPTAAPPCAAVGQHVHELHLPRGAMITMVRRGEATLVPTGDLKLQPGDRLVVFALPRAIRKLQAMLAK